MNISTSYFFDQAVRQMGDLQVSIAKTQMQIATGQQLTQPSDNPEKVTAIQRLKSAIVRQESYAATLASVGDRLKAEETSIKSAGDAMTRVKELTLQAANDTLSTADRANIGAELGSIRASLYALAGTRDVNGNYLFSGTRASQQPFSDGKSGRVEYQGDQTSIQVSIGDQRQLTINRPGTRVFTGVARDNGGSPAQAGFFQVLDDLANSVRQSDHNGMQRGLGEIDQLSAGLSQALAQNGADQNVVDLQQSLIDSTKLRLQSTLSGLADTDYTEAITRLQKESLGLEAAQSSFAKTANLTLFNFIK